MRKFLINCFCPRLWRFCIDVFWNHYSPTVHTECLSGVGIRRADDIHNNNVVHQKFTSPWVKIYWHFQLRNPWPKCIETFSSWLRAKKHNLNMKIRQHNYTFLIFFLFQALVCAEVTVLQETIPPTLLLFQTKQLHFTINGQWSQLTIFLNLHPLLTILDNPVGQIKTGLGNWINLHKYIFLPSKRRTNGHDDRKLSNHDTEQNLLSAETV